MADISTLATPELHVSNHVTRRAWIAASTCSFLVEEAHRTLPHETGGVLMGYWSEDQSQVVITRAIGPGPKAQHDTKSFIPDCTYQIEEIARHYHNTGRQETYLGDWHTHPGRQTPMLGWRDRHTLHRIATDPNARAPRALMAILAGPPWKLRIWRHRRSWVWFGLGANELTPKLY